MKRFLLIPFVLALSACTDNEKDPYYVPRQDTIKAAVVEKTPEDPVVTSRSLGWKVELQARFYAGYQNNEREILIITDPSGKQYLAITGCGVTEIVKKGKTVGEE